MAFGRRRTVGYFLILSVRGSEWSFAPKTWNRIEQDERRSVPLAIKPKNSAQGTPDAVQKEPEYEKIQNVRQSQCVAEIVEHA